MKQYQILCYGDSNTWGFRCKDATRFPGNIRWTGRLSEMLGPEFHIIEEGLCGRTSGFPDEVKPYSDGYSYLLPCLLSHNPINYITVMLGTNDIKTRFQASHKDIAASIEKMLQLMLNTVNARNAGTKILLIAPVPVNHNIVFDPEYDISAVKKSELLLPELESLAKKLQLGFLNANDFVTDLAEDGCHLTEESHKKLADAIAEKIRRDLQL